MEKMAVKRRESWSSHSPVVMAMDHQSRQPTFHSGCYLYMASGKTLGLSCCREVSLYHCQMKAVHDV